jgi:FeS assembly SUF system protein
MSGAPTLKDFLAGGAQPAGAEDEGAMARAGAPLPPDARPASEEAIIDAIKTVYDPEIPVNLYDLGLIYRLDLAASGNVAIDMTLTAPGCPVAGEMPGKVAEAVAAVPGVGEVEVHLVWEPPWTKERMSEDAKLALDIF